MIILFITECCYLASNIWNIGKVIPFKGNKSRALIIILINLILSGILVTDRSHLQLILFIICFLQMITYFCIFDINIYQAIVL